MRATIRMLLPQLTHSTIYTKPYVIPKQSLTGQITERTDVRVLQVLYGFESVERPIFVGQQLDVFIEAKPESPQESGVEPWMLHIARKLLIGDRAKYVGLLIGISFTAFLVTFAASCLAGFMTRGFSLIAENPAADIWVMDPAVSSTEQTINIPDFALDRVRNVERVRFATPLALGTVAARFPNGRFQSFDVIGADDATLAGAPLLRDGSLPTVLHAPADGH